MMRFLGTLTMLFFVLLIIELYGETTQNYTIITPVKPLLMPVLLVLFMLNAQMTLLIERICFVIALSLSCVGDILFIKIHDGVFITGLIIFLLAHIAYIVSFFARDEQRRHAALSMTFFSSIPFMAYFAIALYVLYPNVNENNFLLPVIIYGFVVVLMSYVAYLRDRKVSGYWFVFLGAILFIMSDSLLAFNQFVGPIPLSGLPIMATYSIGQYLITVGFLKSTAQNLKNA